MSYTKKVRANFELDGTMTATSFVGSGAGLTDLPGGGGGGGGGGGSAQAIAFSTQFGPAIQSASPAATWTDPGNSTRYASNAANGQTFTFSAYLTAGTYTLYANGYTGSDEGKVDWTMDGGSIATGQDWYSASAVLTTKSITGLSVASDGVHVFTITVNGKNASSSNYFIVLGQIYLINAATSGAGISGELILPTTTTLTAASGIYEDTGLSVDLPGAGTYEIAWQLRVGLTAGGGGAQTYSTCKLVNVTDSTDVANSESLVVQHYNGNQALAGGEASDGNYTFVKVVTVTAAKTIKVQIKISIGTGSFASKTITSDAAGRSWISFKGVTSSGSGTTLGDPSWTNATYENSWHDLDASTYGSGAFRLRPDGWVQLRVMTAGGSSATARMFTLPTGYRPDNYLIFFVPTADGITRVDITPSGFVTQVAQTGSATSTTWVNLDSIEFLASGSTGQITTGGNGPGTTTNDDAIAGYPGEYVSSTVASGSAVSLTSNTAANVTSISLTAGDWDVTGVVGYTAGTLTVVTDTQQGSSSTSATLGPLGSFTTSIVGASVTIDPVSGIPMWRFSLAATTTIYLVTKTVFTTSTLAAYGVLRARRVR